MKRKPYPLYAVTWLDHYAARTGWTHIEDMDEKIDKYQVVTVGFIVNEDKDSIMLSDTIAANRMTSNHMVVLKATVVKKEKLDYSVML
jgi:hypothetical protein